MTVKVETGNPLIDNLEIENTKTRLEKEILKQEAEIMKNVPGWKVGEKTYHSDRWVPRHVAPLDKNLKK